MGRDSKTPTQSEPTLPPGAPRVRLCAAAGKPAARVETCQPVTLIGSRRDCDFSVSNTDVSKIHCALVNTGTAIIVTDLCSRAGTFVNGHTVSVATLRPGDELRVGPVPVDAEFLDPPSNSAAATARSDAADVTLAAPLLLSGAEGQFELTTLPAVIGRRKACQVVLDTPDVSLAHALLLTIAGCPAVFDLGSRSGTYLNTERITLAWLHTGDRLCIGGEELALAWEGPEHAEHEATTAEAVGASSAPAADKSPAGAVHLPGLGDLESMIQGLKGQISASQAKLQERTVMLEQREGELEAKAAELEQQRTELTLERQESGKQAAELQASASALEQDRARFESRRSEFEEDRSRLESLRGELEQRIAEYEATVAGLNEREAVLDERQAAVAAVERQLADRQADLARREAANAEATRKIEQFRRALNEARSAFSAIDEPCSDLPAAISARPVTSGGQARQSGDEARCAAIRPPPGDGLPAPMVDKPLFNSVAVH